MRARTRTVLREAALTIGAGLGLLCLLLAVVAPQFGVRLLVFQSGSMSPTVETGGLAVARTVAAADLAMGDIVSVHTASGQRVTHRIVGMERAGAQSLLTLQGDANPTPDAEPYPVTEADRVLLHVNHLGFVAQALASPYAVFLAGALVAGVVLLAFGRRGPRAPTGGRRRAPRPDIRGRRRAPVAAAAVVALVGVAGLAVPLAMGRPVLTPTLAAWTDQANVTGSASGVTLVSQAQPACAEVNGLLSLGNVARLTWSHVHALYEYTWELRTTGGAVVSTGVVPESAQATGSMVTLNISTSLIGTNANYNVVVRAGLAATPAWVAATTTTTPVRRASIIIIGASMRCGHS